MAIHPITKVVGFLAELFVIDFSEDVSFTIAINKFGDLVIIKSQFGTGESGIVIKPAVSNEIHLT